MPPRRKKEQGAIWVSSTGDVYKDSDIDVDTIRKLAVSNVYARGLWKKLKNMIFNENPTIEVFTDTGDEDEDLSNNLEAMFEDAGCWEGMQKAFMDVFFFGASFYNPVWEDRGDGNGIVLTDLRHLPAYSFNSAMTMGYTLTDQYHGILNGVVYDKNAQQIRYYQTDEYKTVEITDILHVKEPDSDSLAGDPVIYPLVPVIEMLKYVWNANMQTANRLGAPVIFIKITAPRPASSMLGGMSDADWAKSFIENWGKDTALTLRENMELIPLNITEGDIAGRIIDQLEKLLLDHISPAKFVTKTGTLIGGSTESEGEMMEAYIRGQHTWLAGAFEELLNNYFKYNGFPQGYYCRIHIPITLPGQTTTSMSQATVGYQTKCLDINERRQLLGFEPLDDESKEKLLGEYTSMQPSPFGFPGGGGGGGPEQGATGIGAATGVEEMQTLIFRTPIKQQWDQRKAESLAKSLDDLLTELGEEVIQVVEEKKKGDEKSTPLEYGGEGSGHWGHEGRPGEVGGSDGGGGGTISDKSNTIISKAVKDECGSPEEFNSPKTNEIDKKTALTRATTTVTASYSWKTGSMDIHGESPPTDKPYASIIYQARATGDYEPKIGVKNSFGIKDDLKARGYTYSAGEWSISSEPDYPKGIKEEVDYLKSKHGVITKFGSGEGGEYYPKTHEVLIGRKDPTSTTHKDLISQHMKSTWETASTDIVSKIEKKAKEFGVEQN